jgi:hypothetical protein
MKSPINQFSPLLFLAVAASLVAQTPSDPCPMHAMHGGSDAHHAMVESHGDKAMGFPHDKTTHHFGLSPNGGSIEVTANDPSDTVNIEAIRMHLGHIATMFGEGDFSTPMLVHDGIPPGVTSMKLLKKEIQFQYQPVGAGGRVSIASSDPLALAAIHDFLRFQITDHGTGDPLEIKAAK